MSLFTTDAEVINIGEQYLIIVSSFYILFSTMVVFNGLLRGAGATLIPMLSRLLEVERLGRAFLSTTNERYLKAYRYNFRQLRSDLEILKEENSENKNQLARIYRVDSFINQKQHIFESMVWGNNIQPY